MAAWLDNVRFNPTAGALTDWTYSTAVGGYQSPASAGAVNGTKYKYFAIDTSNNWELGEGAWNSGTTVLARTTIISSSTGSKINFAAAPQVAIVAIKEDMISIEEANSFTTTQQAQARSNINAAIAPTTFTNALGADVALSTISTYVDGPSVSQGTTGTWFVSGSVTVVDTAGLAGFDAKLWDGTTVIASGSSTTGGANFRESISLSGVITNPAGNLRITVRDISSGSGKIVFNVTGNSKDSTITANRIA